MIHTQDLCSRSSLRIGVVLAMTGITLLFVLMVPRAGAFAESSPSPEQVNLLVELTGYSGIYDSHSHGVVLVDRGKNLRADDTIKYLVDGIEVSNVFKDVTDSEVTVQIIRGGTKIWEGSAQVSIAKAELTIVTNSDAKPYDGTALSGSGAGGRVEGLVGGETVGFTITGSQTEVGFSANTFNGDNVLLWAAPGNRYSAQESNYRIKEVSIGSLVVTHYPHQVVVIVSDDTVMYDGKLHEAPITVCGLPSGYTVEGTPISHASAIDVNGGGLSATCDTIVIRDARNTIVYKRVNGIESDNKIGGVVDRPGFIKVVPRELTVTTYCASKPFDALPLMSSGSVTNFVIGESYSFSVTGSQTQVGISQNTYSLVFDGTAKKENYLIKEQYLGDLTVSPYQGEYGKITVSTVGGTYLYDGQPHAATVVVTLPDMLTGVYHIETAESTRSVTNATATPLAVTCDRLVIFSVATGAEVTDALIQAGYVAFIDDVVAIEKRPITIRTDSASKLYDGTALTAQGTIENLVVNETLEFAATGSQTEVGASVNTYLLNWSGTANPQNYCLVEVLGTLTVIEQVEVRLLPQAPTANVLSQVTSEPASPSEPDVPVSLLDAAYAAEVTPLLVGDETAVIPLVPHQGREADSEILWRALFDQTGWVSLVVLAVVLAVSTGSVLVLRLQRGKHE